MVTFIKYALFFAAVFVVFLGIAWVAFMNTMGGSAGVVGWYMEYDHDIGQVTAFQTKIGYYIGQKLYEAPGEWSHHVFYEPSHVGAPDAVIARILPNEDLQLNLVKFDPQDTRVVIAVKTRRQPDEFHPYPVAKQDDHPSYPPPKGLIRPGMLECDLEDLPWQPYDKQEPPILDPYHPNEHEDYGTDIINGWPRTWLYKSDDPKLPELRVVVEKGHVTQVNGGAEDTAAIDYAPQAPPPDASGSSDSGGSVGWLHWLIGLLLGK